MGCGQNLLIVYYQLVFCPSPDTPHFATRQDKNGEGLLNGGKGHPRWEIFYGLARGWRQNGGLTRD